MDACRMADIRAAVAECMKMRVRWRSGCRVRVGCMKGRERRVLRIDGQRDAIRIASTSEMDKAATTVRRPRGSHRERKSNEMLAYERWTREQKKRQLKVDLGLDKNEMNMGSSDALEVDKFGNPSRARGEAIDRKQSRIRSRRNSDSKWRNFDRLKTLANTEHPRYMNRQERYFANNVDDSFNRKEKRWNRWRSKHSLHGFPADIYRRLMSGNCTTEAIDKRLGIDVESWIKTAQPKEINNLLKTLADNPDGRFVYFLS